MRGALGAFLVLSFGLIMFPTVGVVYLTALVIGGSVAYVLAGKGPPSKYLSELNQLLYEGERVVVATALIVMSVLVFADVVWSTAHGADPKTAKSFLVGLFVLSMVGGFTAHRDKPASLVSKVLSGFAAYVCLLVVGALIYIVPNGFGWSQRVALCLILWVGLLGGSMATYQGRHIAIDAVRRVVPDRFERSFELVAGLVTVGVTGMLTALAVLYVRGNWHEWVESEMTAGIFESIPIPYWTATLSIPIGFGLMTARFLDVALHGQEKTDLLASLGVEESEGEGT